MQFWGWLIEVYAYEKELFTVVVVAVGMVALAAFVGYFLKSTGVFAALSVVIVSLARVFIVDGQARGRAASLGGTLLITCSGITYLLLFTILRVREKILERKRRRAEIARRLCYTLPDRENTYIRARLSTALQSPKSELNAHMGGSDGMEQPIKLEYARRLLNRVREAPLSHAEHLQTEEMSKVLSLYLRKDVWTKEDIRAVNELCASLLKLSAKYAV